MFLNRFVACCFIVIITVSESIAKNPSSTLSDTANSVYPTRVAILFGGIAGFRYIGLSHVEQTWYTGQKAKKIRWRNDWKGQTYLNIDKGGHFMSGLFTASSISNASSWAGFSQKTSAILGTLISWSALFEIEMRDAYQAQWGFSIPDFAANTIGASIPLLYTLYPQSRSIKFKFGYYPSVLYLDRRERSSKYEPHINHMIDDYEGMSFWISIPSAKLFPEILKSKIPPWARLALGYSAKGLHGSNKKSRGQNKGYPDLPDALPEIFIGMDYDTENIPGSHYLWRSFLQQLNWLRIPAPAIRIYPDLAFYFFLI